MAEFEDGALPGPGSDSTHATFFPSGDIAACWKARTANIACIASSHAGFDLSWAGVWATAVAAQRKQPASRREASVHFAFILSPEEIFRCRAVKRRETKSKRAAHWQLAPALAASSQGGSKAGSPELRSRPICTAPAQRDNRKSCRDARREVSCDADEKSRRWSECKKTAPARRRSPANCCKGCRIFRSADRKCAAEPEMRPTLLAQAAQRRALRRDSGFLCAGRTTRRAPSRNRRENPSTTFH